MYPNAQLYPICPQKTSSWANNLRYLIIKYNFAKNLQTTT